MVRRLVTKKCEDCNKIMFNVSLLRKYCDKCGEERQRLSQRNSVRKHYNDPRNAARRTLYHHNQWLEIVEAKKLMDMPKVIENAREKIMRGGDEE